MIGVLIFFLKKIWIQTCEGAQEEDSHLQDKKMSEATRIWKRGIGQILPCTSEKQDCRFGASSLQNCETIHFFVKATESVVLGYLRATLPN